MLYPQAVFYFNVQGVVPNVHHSPQHHFAQLVCFSPRLPSPSPPFYSSRSTYKAVLFPFFQRSMECRIYGGAWINLGTDSLLVSSNLCPLPPSPLSIVGTVSYLPTHFVVFLLLDLPVFRLLISISISISIHTVTTITLRSVRD